jgi:tetratricopeptide (TPR) repeat protein
MKLEIFIFAALVAAAIPAGVWGQSERSMLERAERDITRERYADAESALTLVTRSASGDVLLESLYLLAGLQSSVDDAARYYRRIIDDDPRNDWAKRAQLELSKIEYAMGNYEESFRILDESDACDVSDEACLFQGLSAIMLERYREARTPLASIRRGKLRTWAYLSLAEADTGLNRPDQACTRYKALAGAMISPTALYRYGECLENEGDVEGAAEEYKQIIRTFRDTPEAVLAAEKLLRFAEQPLLQSAPDTAAAQEEPPPALTSGYTVQFGSFRDRGNAIKLAAKIKRVFPGVRIDSELINYREYHRVRFGYYATREEAQAKAEELAREMNEDFTIMKLP